MSFFRDFLHWWTTTIDNSLSRRDGGAKVVHVGRETLSFQGKQGVASEVPLVAQSSARAHGGVLRGQKLLVHWLPGTFIYRRLAPVPLTHSSLLSASALDLRHSTPFANGSVISSPGNDGSASGHVIRKRDFHENVQSTLANLGGTVVRERFEAADGMIADRKPEGAVPGQWLLVICVAGFLGGVLTTSSIFLRELSAQSRLEAAIGELYPAVQEVAELVRERRNREAQLSQLAEEKRNSAPVSLVWEDMARALPDSAYLTELQILEGQVTAAGFARSSAPIIPALEGVQRFHAVEWAAPVVRVVGQGETRERITVRMKVVQP